jgi:hypothetical protein
MAYLLDTNLLLRLDRRNDPQRQLVLEALRKLRPRNEVQFRASLSLHWRFLEILVMFYGEPE